MIDLQKLKIKVKNSLPLDDYEKNLLCKQLDYMSKQRSKLIDRKPEKRKRNIKPYSGNNSLYLKAVKLATDQRKNIVTSERILKDELIKRGIQFNHQQPFAIEPTFCVVDFYFGQIKLAVELDGPSHNKRKKKDEIRSQRLKDIHNVRVMRFMNQEVKRDVSGVVDRIVDQL